MGWNQMNDCSKILMIDQRTWPKMKRERVRLSDWPVRINNTFSFYLVKQTRTIKIADWECFQSYHSHYKTNWSITILEHIFIHSFALYSFIQAIHSLIHWLRERELVEGHDCFAFCILRCNVLVIILLNCN